MTTTPNDDPQEPRGEQPMALLVDQPSDEESAAGAVARFRQDSEDGWTVAGTVSRGPHGHVISRLEVWPGRPDDPPSGSVTSRLLNSIRVGTIIDAVRHWEMQMRVREMAARMEHDPDDQNAQRLVDEAFREPILAPGSGVTVKSADEILSTAPKKPQPGRAPLPDELLQQVAESYLAETAPGKPRGGVKRLAEQLGRPEQTVSRWVARARKEGWLGPGRQGHEGAEAGPRLLKARSARRP